jgi:hypothetical protein
MYVVLETGYTERFEPAAEYAHFDYVGKVTDDHQASSEWIQQLHEWVRAQRGYLIFRKKPDVEVVTMEMIYELLDRINERPYCAFLDADEFIGSHSQRILLGEESYDLCIYEFDTESGCF